MAQQADLLESGPYRKGNSVGGRTARHRFDSPCGIGGTYGGDKDRRGPEAIVELPSVLATRNINFPSA